MGSSRCDGTGERVRSSNLGAAEVIEARAGNVTSRHSTFSPGPVNRPLARYPRSGVGKTATMCSATCWAGL